MSTGSIATSNRKFTEMLPRLASLFEVLRSWAGFALASLVKRLYWAPLESSQCRAACFDAASPSTLMLSCVGDERFLVSSNDRVIGRTVFIGGEFEFSKFETVLSLLDNSFDRELLVDIGANIGTLCVPAVKRRLFKRAIAFEPEPFNYSLLSANVIINGLSDRIKLYNIALGDTCDGQVAFQLSANNYGDHRVKLSHPDGKSDGASGRVIFVKSETLDVALEHSDSGKMLIWMDTQGFEGYILRGAEKTLSTKPPIVLEFWPHRLNRSCSYQLLKQAICRAGYRIFYDLKGKSPSPPTEVSENNFDRLFRQLGDDEPNPERPRNFTDLLIM